MGTDASQEELAHPVIAVVVYFVLSSVHVTIYAHECVEKVSLRVHLTLRVLSETPAHFNSSGVKEDSITIKGIPSSVDPL